MSDEKVKELEAMIVVLRKMINELERKIKGGLISKPDSAWLSEVKKEAEKIKL